MRNSGLFLLLGILSSPMIALRAQGVTTPNQGQLVRVTARGLFDRPARGVVVTQRGDTLILRDTRNRGDAALLRVPLSAIERLDVRRRRSRGSGAKRGLTIGLLAGAVTGAALGAATTGSGSDFSPAGAAAWVGLLGAGAGAIVGTVLGAVTPGTRWEEWPLPARVGLVPVGGSRVGLAALIRL